jgi:hypothetical protein
VLIHWGSRGQVLWSLPVAAGGAWEESAVGVEATSRVDP